MAIPLDDLQSALQRSQPTHLAYSIVNAPFKHRFEMVALGIGIIVFLVADKKSGIIHRVALSRTEMAAGTVRMSQKEFTDIKIPINHMDNIIARAIHNKAPEVTEDWKYLFTPALAPEQARMNQAGGAIACSFVYPLEIGKGGSGALIFSYYKFLDKIDAEDRKFMAAYSQLVSKRLAVCSPADFVAN
jgi:hypothetical protein